MLSVAYFSKIAEKHTSDDRLVELAKALGNKNAKTPEDFIAALQKLQQACGADKLKMSDYGIEKSACVNLLPPRKLRMPCLSGSTRVT